jgi:hypothetical protein
MGDRKTQVIETGSDPIGNGKFKMYPSGDIVDFEERNNRLPETPKDFDEPRVFGAYSRSCLERMQGGRLR